MATITHTMTTGYRGGNVSISGTGRTYVGNNIVEFIIDVPANSTKTLTMAGAGIDVSKMVACAFEASKALTMTTNDDGTPDDNYVLAANKPVVWGNDFPAELPNPLTVDVVSIKLVNAGSDVSTFMISVLQDLD